MGSIALMRFSEISSAFSASGTTADDFRKRPHSEPVNEVISNVFFKSGLMEAWGRGIPVLATYNIIEQNHGIQRKDIIAHTKKGSSVNFPFLQIL